MNRNAINFRRSIFFPILTPSMVSTNDLWILLDFLTWPVRLFFSNSYVSFLFLVYWHKLAHPEPCGH